MNAFDTIPHWAPLQPQPPLPTIVNTPIDERAKWVLHAPLLNWAIMAAPSSFRIAVCNVENRVAEWGRPALVGGNRGL